MKRQHLFGLSTTVAAVALATVATAATPAGAASLTCRTTIAGGLVGNLVIGSSTDVYGEAVTSSQRVTIDRVTVNYFGEKRYRLASPVKLVTAQGSTRTAFTGGTGSYVSAQSLRMTPAFTSCSRSLQA